MSVTLTPPPTLAFSLNTIPVTLISDDVTDTAGVAAVITISFTGAVANGNTIGLVWGYGKVTLTAAGVPDNSGDQIPSGDGSAGYVADLVDYFNQKFEINRDFVITSAGTNLILTGRETGINNNAVPFAAGNISVTVTTAGITQTLKPNFRHLLEVWLSGAQIYSRTLLLAPPAIAGFTEKDLGEILHPFLGSDKPSLTAVNWQACPNSLQLYFIKYAQVYGDTPAVKRVYQSPVAYVNKGGLDIEAALNQTAVNFLKPNNQNSAVLCLRQGSKNVIIQQDQPEFLYWINLTGADINIKLRVCLYFTDGTSLIFYMPAVNALAWRKYYVPVGYAALNVPSNMPTGKLLSFYSCTVGDDPGNFLSSTYYYFIGKYQEYPRFFIYLNSLGGYQSLYTWGKAEQNTDRTKADYSRQVTDAEAAISGRDQESNIRLQDSAVVNTGYTSLRDLKLLKDFFVSQEKYLVENGRLIPIGLRSDKLPTGKDGENLNAGQFEYYKLFQEVAYTDDPGAPDTVPADGQIGGGVSQGFDMIVDDGNNEDNNYYQDL